MPSITQAKAPPINLARALVFFASFCFVTIEIVAGRVTAPYLGVSLYTWTSVIGAVLLGVTAGNYAGGWIADHRLSTKSLGLSFAFAGLMTLATNTLARTFGPMLASSHWPLWLSASLFALAVFFPAAFFLSTVSPQVVKFHLKELEHTGMTVGNIGAWSALGSIIGTFASGFIFIAFVGTKLLLTLIAVLLLIVGVIVAWRHRIWRHRMSLFIGLLLAGDLMIPGMCRMETNYYCIRTFEVAQAQGATTTAVYLDHLIHSYVTPGEPEAIGYEYEYVQAGLAAYRFEPQATFSTLTIGGGGYSMPRYLASAYPHAQITVVEIDPGVTEFNYRALDLPRDTRIQSVHKDARVFLRDLDPEVKYDLVYGDAVNDFAVPFQLTTREFYALLKPHLAPGGIYAATIIDDPSYAEFTAALIRTMREQFAHVYLFPMGSDMYGGAGRNTFELVATDEPLDAIRWSQSRPHFSDPKHQISEADWQGTSAYLTTDDLEAFLRQRRAPVLTDDFAPVDAYLAPVFDDAYSASRFGR